MSNKRYEAILVFNPELDEAGVRGQVEKVEATIRSHSGAIEKHDIWGRRELSFTVKKKNSGIFVAVIFNGDNTLVTDLERQLRISDSVLRHMIVVKDKHAPDLSAERRAEEVMGLESIAPPSGEDLEGPGDSAL